MSMKKWGKEWRFFGLRFTVIKEKRKKGSGRIYAGGWKRHVDNRMAVFEAQGHKCQICGMEFSNFKQMNAHHVLPWCKFPELRNKHENLVMLCENCHKEVHCNPYINIAMQEAKAQELNIDMRGRYKM